MEENLNLAGLDGKEIYEKLYDKELNTKKNILEYIDIVRVLKKDPDLYSIESTYKFIYRCIDDMSDHIKPNTIMFLKNALKSQLGKYVMDKDPKIENTFIRFFKEAYPEGHRRKDFTWVLMDLNKIVPEQIWTTLTYINRECLTNDMHVTSEEKKDIISMINKLISFKDVKYINKVKSLETLNRVLNIKITSDKDSYKVKLL